MSFYVRSHNIARLYYWSSEIYRNYFKKNLAWQTTLCDLLNFPNKTLGRDFGEFLYSSGFKLEPKLENHDVFHLLTGIGITVWEEIALQYHLLANGKISLYLVMVIATGTLFYPEKWLCFYREFQKGKVTKTFWDTDFEKILDRETQEIRKHFKIKITLDSKL